MKVTENITVYTCDHCKKKYFRKHAAIKHEDNCPANPKNIDACLGCIFLEEEEITIEQLYGEQKSKKFHCTKLNKDLYPHKVIRKGLLEKYPETFEDQELMPTECEHLRWFETEEDDLF